MRGLGLYHRLPYPARCLAASLHGLRLRRFRYGPETPRLVEEALEREAWSAAAWRRYQDEHLGRLLERAVTRVPYYRELWRGRPRAEWEELENWPVLEKETVRQNPRAFLAEDCQLRRMVEEHTSGSTGTPLTLWWSRETARRWYALVEARLRLWHGVSRRDRWAILGGQLVASAEATRPPFWVWNAALRQLYLSSYHLAPAHVAAYLGAIARHRVVYLMGYPSAMAALARLTQDAGLEAPRLRVALSNAEPLDERQRGAIEAVFGGPVRDSYGNAELAAAASECASGTLHLWPEAAIVEVPDGDGRLIATGLLNTDMPLIRYEIGDRVAVAPKGASACACGRLLPALRAVEGRLDDVVRTPDGRRIGRLDPVFKADLPIREAQIVQERLDRVVLRVVPSSGFGAADAADLVLRLGKRLGPAVEVEVETVDRLERGASGKLRGVVSKLGDAT